MSQSNFEYLASRPLLLYVFSVQFTDEFENVAVLEQWVLGVQNESSALAYGPV